MPIIDFNETQKAAIVSLLIEMINADNEVHPNECTVFDSICVEYGICDDTFSLGRSLNSMVAIDIMKHMSDIQTLVTAQLLTRVIDADGYTHQCQGWGRISVYIYKFTIINYQAIKAAIGLRPITAFLVADFRCFYPLERLIFEKVEFLSNFFKNIFCSLKYCCSDY